MNETESPTHSQQALERWKLGHQLFHINITAQNTLIEQILSHKLNGSVNTLVDNLFNLSTLYDAATATMKYASNFSKSAYENTVRPSMMPPAQPLGFSGTLNSEHNTLMHNLVKLRHALLREFGKDTKLWPPVLAQAWNTLSTAINKNKKSHGLVCRKFVDNGESLLRKFHKNKQAILQEN